MASKVEQVLTALESVLQGLSATVLRNVGLPEKIPVDGLLIIHDGDPGKPEILLSPLTYYYTHRAEIDLFVQDIDPNPAFDALKVAVGEALLLDQTLGGLCDWVEPEAPKPQDLPFMGGTPIKAASIIVELTYSTTNPLT